MGFVGSVKYIEIGVYRDKISVFINDDHLQTVRLTAEEAKKTIEIMQRAVKELEGK